jgi:hypothetical protein
VKQAELDNEKKEIAAADGVAAFFDSEIGKQFVELLRRSNYNAWRTCKRDKVLELWDQAQAIEQLVEGAEAVKGRGEMARRARTKREEEDQFNAKRARPRGGIAPADG